MASSWITQPPMVGQAAVSVPGVLDAIRYSDVGKTAIDPTALRVSVTPSNTSVVVNGTPGAPLNLTFLVAAVPHWLGDLGKGNYTSNFEADIVNPNGQIVGCGVSVHGKCAGPTTIAPGAVFGLKGVHTPSPDVYRLTFSYHGTVASVNVTFA